VPDGATVGRLSVEGADGRVERFDLRLGRHVGHAVSASEAGSVLPSVPPPDPRIRTVDYVARIPLPGPLDVTRLAFENGAPTGTWFVRAATLARANGPAQPLLLTTGLERVPHEDPAPVKVYRNPAALPPALLVGETVIADDAGALAFLRGPAFAP